MTTPRPQFQSERRASPRPGTQSSPSLPPRREYRERDFGVGYGRSSGYASSRHYASQWSGAARFRCG